MLKPQRDYKFFLPPVLLALGAFLFFPEALQAQETKVAPYAYSEVRGTNTLRLLFRQEKFLKKRIKKSPDSGLDQASLANTYVQQSNLTGDLKLMDQAEQLAMSSLEDLPFYNYEAKLVLANVAESRHQFEEAIKKLQELLTENPGNRGAMASLVSANLGFGRASEANVHADQLVAVAPSMNSLTLRALVYLAQGKNDLALGDFNRALALEGPDQKLSSAWVRTLMGRYYYRAGDMDTSLKYTDSALNVMPRYHMALAQKADILVRTEKAAEAETFYERAYKEREEPPYLLALANLKQSQGDTARAAKLRSEAEQSVRLEIDTTPYGHYNELAQILIDRNLPEEREQAIVAAQQNVAQRNNSESYYILAQALLNAGRIEEARAALQTAMSTGETNFEYQELAQRLP